MFRLGAGEVHHEPFTVLSSEQIRNLEYNPVLGIGLRHISVIWKLLADDLFVRYYYSYCSFIVHRRKLKAVEMQRFL